MAKTIVARWQGGLRFDTDTARGATVTLAGDGDADRSSLAQPTEMLLAALAACTAMDVVSIAEKKRQVIDRYEVRATGIQRHAHPRAFLEIDVDHEIWGEAIDPEAVRRSIELSATRYCPVNAQLSGGEARVRHSYVVRRGAEEIRAEVVVTGPRGAGLDPLPEEAATAPPQEAHRG